MVFGAPAFSSRVLREADLPPRLLSVEPFSAGRPPVDFLWLALGRSEG